MCIQYDVISQTQFLAKGWWANILNKDDRLWQNKILLKLAFSHSNYRKSRRFTDTAKRLVERDYPKCNASVKHVKYTKYIFITEAKWRLYRFGVFHKGVRILVTRPTPRGVGMGTKTTQRNRCVCVCVYINFFFLSIFCFVEITYVLKLMKHQRQCKNSLLRSQLQSNKKNMN